MSFVIRMSATHQQYYIVDAENCSYLCQGGTVIDYETSLYDKELDKYYYDTKDFAEKTLEKFLYPFLRLEKNHNGYYIPMPLGGYLHNDSVIRKSTVNSNNEYTGYYATREDAISAYDKYQKSQPLYTLVLTIPKRMLDSLRVAIEKHGDVELRKLFDEAIHVGQ